LIELELGYNGQVFFPPFFWLHAEELAHHRNKVARVQTRGQDEYRRGDDLKEQSIEEKGIMGELLARYILARQDEPYKLSPILGGRRELFVAPDVWWREWSIDVKAVTFKDRHFLVNVTAHNKPDKKITHYWCFKIEDRTMARSWVFTYDDVGRWPVNDFGHGSAHNANIQELMVRTEVVMANIEREDPMVVFDL